MRQALLYGTNREAIIDAVFQRFSPGRLGTDCQRRPSFTVPMSSVPMPMTRKRRAICCSAGLSDTNNDGYVDFGGADLEVNIIAPNWGLIPDVAQLIQDQWRDIGIKVNIDPVPSRNLLRQHVDDGQYNLVAWYEFGLDPSFLNRYFLSNGDSNWTGYQRQRSR